MGRLQQCWQTALAKWGQPRVDSDSDAVCLQYLTVVFVYCGGEGVVHREEVGK